MHQCSLIKWQHSVDTTLNTDHATRTAGYYTKLSYEIGVSYLTINAYYAMSDVRFDSLLVSWLGSGVGGQSDQTGLSPGSMDHCIPILQQSR